MRNQSLSSWVHRICLLSTGILLVFNLLTLGRVPEIPGGDDGVYAAAAYRFWETGHPGVPGYRGIAYLDKDVFVFGRTAAAVRGVFMRVFGVSLFVALLPSFLAGVGLLGATYGVGRFLWGQGPAMLAVAILATSGIFFMDCHLARPDMLLALYFVSALYLFASAPAGRWSWHYPVAGLLMGFSGDVHHNGFYLAPIPLLFWLILRQENIRLRVMVNMIYSAGVLVGLGFWLGVHYWPNLEPFLQQFALFTAKAHPIRIVNLGPFGALDREVHRYLSWFWDARLHRHLFEGIAILGCGLWMIIRGGRKERALFYAWLLEFCVSICLMDNPFGWYLIYVWPLFALWIARVFMAVYQTHRRRWAMIAIGILFAGYWGNLTLWAGKAFYGPSYGAISRELRSVIAPGASVVAGGEWWFALHDYDFTDAQHIEFHELLATLARNRGEDLPSGWEGAWRRLRWQYVVAHGDIRDMLDVEVPIQEALASMGAVKAEEIREARTFAINHCRLLRSIPTASTPVLVLKTE